MIAVSDLAGSALAASEQRRGDHRNAEGDQHHGRHGVATDVHRLGCTERASFDEVIERAADHHGRRATRRRLEVAGAQGLQGIC